MRVLFASAELAPLARVGGLAEAAGGLVGALRKSGIDLTVVVPDYGGVELDSETARSLAVPTWADPVRAREGIHPVVGEVILVGGEDMARPNPYVDTEGEGWPDNDMRFMRFSAGIAALRAELGPDVVHLNDWHTAASIALGERNVPTVLTIHTLAYQGYAPSDWLAALTREPLKFEWYGGFNPLAGAIRLADKVIAVSPNYASEILGEASGMGLHHYLRAKGDALVGILNGIDTEDWDPATDQHIAATYSLEAMAGRADCRAELVEAAGWSDSKEPVIGAVSRLVDQKGIDLLIGAIPFLAGLPARLVVLGSGSAELAGALTAAAAAYPERVAFRDGYDLSFAHKVFAGSDLYAMPSRFEPCGLAQMQAMRYGSIPVVTPVGGLVDTVEDADASRTGTGFVAGSVDTAGLVNALHRAVRAHRNARRRAAIQRRGMKHDWSWTAAAAQHVAIYEELSTLR